MTPESPLEIESRRYRAVVILVEVGAFLRDVGDFESKFYVVGDVAL